MRALTCALLAVVLVASAPLIVMGIDDLLTCIARTSKLTQTSLEEH